MQDAADQQRVGTSMSVDHSTTLSHASQRAEDSHSVSSSAMARRNKLRKAHKDGYESDGGYISEGGKKAKKGWSMKKSKGTDGYESDGGYLSEAQSNTKASKKASKEKSKTKKAKDKEDKEKDAASPITDPSAFLQTVNATLPLLAPTQSMDGYLTDSAASPSKRGRSKAKKSKDVKEKDKGGRSRAASLERSGDAEGMPGTPSKRGLLSRMMSRSQSRDRGKDNEREKDVVPPMPPMPPMPMSLPIAEKFARKPPALNLAISTASSSSASTSALGPLLTSGATSTDAGNGLPSTLALPNIASPAPLSPDVWNDDVMIPSAGKPELQARPRVDASAPTSSFFSTNIGRKSVVPNAEPPRAATPARSQSPTNHKPSVISSILTAPITPERRRKTRKTSSPSGSTGSADSMTSSSSGGSAPSSRPVLKVSTKAISLPNPHLNHKLRTPPNPLQLAASLQMNTPAAQGGGLSPGYLYPRASSPSQTNPTPDSFVFVDREGSGVTTPFSLISSSEFIVPSPGFQAPASPSSAGSDLATRRSKNVAPLQPIRPLNITPKSSRSNTPVQNPANANGPGLSVSLSPSVPTTPTHRASVIAYYQLPPPSPPPTGPLPRVPDHVLERRDSEDRDRKFLAPETAYIARAPSPLRNAASLRAQASRSPSPGLYNQPIPTVKRGKESPFPTRPILPTEEGRMLVRRASAILRSRSPRLDPVTGLINGQQSDVMDSRVARYKYTFVDSYAADDTGMENDNDRADAFSSSEEGGVDRHSSAYIRQARARGEKRVYFSDHTTSTSASEDDHAFATDDFEADRSQYGVDNNVNTVVDVNVNEDAYDQRSLASMSVYSRYSVLDAETSAEVREGFVRRVEAMVGGVETKPDMRGRGRGRWEDVPAVPELPASLRGAYGSVGSVSEQRRLKASSPFMF